MKSSDRAYESLIYKSKRSAKLTVKQYLVYSYLMSISKWNAKDHENHYYVYKNSFKVKDACALLDISQPTWRSAIKKLIDLSYIYYNETTQAYLIYQPLKPFAPLDYRLIRELVTIGTQIGKMSNGEVGGNIVSVYSLLYTYWMSCGNDPCNITISQLKQIYTTKRKAETTVYYRYMLGYFHAAGLMDIQYHTGEIGGNTYIYYSIKNVKTALPVNYDQDSPVDDIMVILKAINSSELDIIELEE